MRYSLQGRAAVGGKDKLIDYRGAEGVQPSDRPELGTNRSIKARADGYVAANGGSIHDLKGEILA